MALKFEVATLGTWVYLNSVINLGFMFVNIGFDKIHLQYSSKKNLSDYFSTFFLIQVILILINVSISLLIITTLGLWGEYIVLLLLILLISKSLFQFGNIFLLNFRAKIKVFKAEIPLFFSIISKSLLKIIIAINSDIITDILLYLCIFHLIIDIFTLYIIFKFSVNEFNLKKPKKKIAFSYIKDAKFLILISILTVIASYIGNLLLDLSLGHETLSYFSLVNYYLIPVLLMVSGSLASVYLPLFSQHYKNNDYTSIRETIYIIEKYASILFLCLILIVDITGELIFTLFLPSYTSSLPFLYIMLIIPYLGSISRPYGYFLISGKKQMKYAQIIIITQILTICLIFISIFSNFFLFGLLILDPLSYSISNTIPWLIWALMSRYYVNKHFNIKPQKKVLVHVILAVISYFIIRQIYNFISQIIANSLIVLILSISITISVYLTFLFLFKELKMNDIKFLVNLINYKDYIKSMKEEFNTDNE
ncbi:MAG: hypothetical protein GF311_23270 [Candidatus Lokiarchaeota archaeon]|nr:hypothetical protein [Candidatus Lokiarchaeota archaeon]